MAAATAERLTRRAGGAPPVPPPTPKPPRRQEKVHLPQPTSSTASPPRRVQAFGRSDWIATSSSRIPSPPSPRLLLAGVGGGGGGGKMGAPSAPSLPPPPPSASNFFRNSSPSPKSSPARRRRRPPPPLAPLSRSHEDARFSPTRSVSPLSSSTSKTLPHPPPRAAFHGSRVTARPHFSPPRLNRGRSGSATSPSFALGETSVSIKGTSQIVPQVKSHLGSTYTHHMYDTSKIGSASAHIYITFFCSCVRYTLYVLRRLQCI